MLSAIAALLLAACSGAASEEAAAVTSPAAEAAPKPQDASKARDGIALLILDSKLNAMLIEAELRGIQLGNPKKANGEPLTVEGLQDEAKAMRQDLSGRYVQQIERLPDGDLRDALKQDFAAQDRYFGLFDSRLGSHGWASKLAEANEEKDRARSQLEMEMKLAFR